MIALKDYMIVPRHADSRIVDAGARIQGGYDPTDMAASYEVQVMEGASHVPATLRLFDVGRLSEEEVEEIKTHILGKQPMDEPAVPKHGWTCFHCGQTFKTAFIAQLHFGEPFSGPPACQSGDQAIASVQQEFDNAVRK